MRILFLFVDGIGLGEDDPDINPFAHAVAPTLMSLAGGHRWLVTTGRQATDRTSFIPTDPRLNVAGRPQSGTSQAAILTGRNIPSMIGRHYGPKPDEQTRHILQEDNLFIQLRNAGKRTALIDGYPPRLLESIARGKTLPSSIQYAAIASGQALFTAEDVRAERAITAEWTGDEWHTHLKITDVPRYTPQQAGHKLVEISRAYDFAFHSHWITDYIGHRGTLTDAVAMVQRLDGVLAGVLEAWDDQQGLVILTSDHGNMETIGDRHHTENDVPTLVIGHDHAQFAAGLAQLTDIAPRIFDYLTS